MISMGRIKAEIRGGLLNWVVKRDLSEKGMWEWRLESGEGASPDEFWGKNIPGEGIVSANVLSQKMTGMFEEEQGGQCAQVARQKDGKGGGNSAI